MAACAGAKCPASAVEILTEEGPVIVEHWSDNTVLVTESFDQSTAGKLLDAVRGHGTATQAQTLGVDELGFRLYDSPEFSAFQGQIGERLLHELERTAK